MASTSEEEPVYIRSLVRSRLACSGAGAPREFAFIDDAKSLIFLGADASRPLSDSPLSSLYTVSLSSSTTSSSASPISWKPLLQHLPSTAPSTLSKEEELLRERMRTQAVGVTSFRIHSESSTIFVPLQGGLYRADLSSLTSSSMSSSSKPSLHPIGASADLHATSPLPAPTDDPVVNASAPVSAPATYMDAKPSPDGTMLAFIRDRDIWVVHIESNRERRLTYSADVMPNTPPMSGRCRERSCGVAEYVMQEEFDRFTGFWWSPTRNPQTGFYEILYLHVDQSQVPVVGVPLYSMDSTNSTMEYYHYPRPGDPNAVSSPRIIPVPDPPRVATTHANIVPNKLDTWAAADPAQYERERAWQPRTPLEKQFPWYEYVVRAGWVPMTHVRSGGDLQDDVPSEGVGEQADSTGELLYGIRAFWLLLLDRRQQRMELVIFPAFGEGAGVSVLADRASDWWVNVNDNLKFLSRSRAVLYTTEKTGCAHIYYRELPLLGEALPAARPSESADTTTTSAVPGPSDSDNSVGDSEHSGNVRGFAVTSGEDWVVQKILGVDEKRKLVYFSSTKGTPLERHLCVASFANPTDPSDVRVLTAPGYLYNNFKMADKLDVIVCNFSNVSTKTRTVVYRIDGLLPADAAEVQKVSAISLKEIAHIANPGIHSENLPTWPLKPPQFFSFPAEDGTILHGCYYKPTRMTTSDPAPGKGPYPTILAVYGGPHVQLVKNEYRLTCALKTQLLAALGYAVVHIDGRGSFNRGARFESALRSRFGYAELKDQVRGLEYLIDKGIVDRSRIAVSGWSYGAYAAAMLLARWGDVFKLAVCGAAVTAWEGYDSAYTERYLGLPEENSAGYAASSVLTYADEFPDKEGRLLLVHSLMDENVHATHTISLVDALIARNKQHSLILFPKERHGLRDPSAQLHFETAFLNFLNKNMRE